MTHLVAVLEIHIHIRAKGKDSVEISTLMGSHALTLELKLKS